jgi:hypothetical protein
MILVPFFKSKYEQNFKKEKHHYNGQGGGYAFQCWPRRVADIYTTINE